MSAMSGEVAPTGSAVLLYDGVCGLCNRLVRFVLARDFEGRVRFAPLQSAFAREALSRHGENAENLDTVFRMTGFGTQSERVFRRSRAVLRVLEELPAPWRSLAAFRALPPRVLDRLYDLVARSRYRIFGKSDRCELPPPEQRGRFIGL
jgi:predicted DCC family thiol-disulfide oxidoreductase YuxK